MMSSELVSIIVPVYNGEKYIEHCVQSIESQNYKNIELLIIDDGSIDYTYDIVSNLKDKYNNLEFYPEPKKGICHARNLGLSKAKEVWLTFVDVDDS